MPKVKCEWTACKHNSLCKAEEPEDIGECLSDEEVELVLSKGNEPGDEHLICKQFEWGNEE